MFTDHVVIQLKAGNGGNGVIAWRREKYIPKGGPTGGDGGDGASIFVEADTQLFSLEAYRNTRLIKAEDGAAGGGACKHGKRGQDLVVKVPLGTLIKDASGHILHDFTQDKERIRLCAGGKGGKGNNHFKTSTNRSPYQQTNGTQGLSLEVELELKLIADIGLVGLPNSGKSTFLKSATNVKVKIAPYPFTTLQPNLGFVIDEMGERVLLADIPGIIAGANQNKGLGLEFLRHIERTRHLLFVLDAAGAEGRDPVDDYKVLLNELKVYNSALLDKPRAIILNKVDLPESADHIKNFRKKIRGEKIFELSALSNIGMKEILSYITALKS